MGVKATESGKELLEEALVRWGQQQKREIPPRKLRQEFVDSVYVSLKTLSRFFSGEVVSEDSARPICQALDLKLEDVINPTQRQDGYKYQAIVFVDIVSSTKIIEEMGDDPYKNQVLAPFDHRLKKYAKEFQGQSSNFTGDGRLMTFPDIPSAIN